jgi:membrane protease YdiL (CAAX protease family)
VLAVLVLVTIEAGVVSIFDPDLDSLGATLGVQALLAVTLIAVALAFATRSTSLASALGELGLRRFARSALGLAAVAYVAYLIFAVIYSAFVHPEQEDITRDLGFDEGGIGAFVAGALIVAVAPLSEEIFFRGFMFGGLRRRLPMWAAAVIAGAVFGLLHYTGPDSIGVVPQLAVLGVLLAWLYERTGSLWPPIILHVANNGLALIALTSS